MKHWQNLSEDERREVLEITSAKKRLPQLAVEKDWWVTMTLKALSMTKHYGLMSFKGGTSLSKGWNLINRFRWMLYSEPPQWNPLENIFKSLWKCFHQ